MTFYDRTRLKTQTYLEIFMIQDDCNPTFSVVHIIINCIPFCWHFGMWYRWSALDAVNNIPIQILAGKVLELTLVGVKPRHKKATTVTGLNLK